MHLARDQFFLHYTVGVGGVQGRRRHEAMVGDRARDVCPLYCDVLSTTKKDHDGLAQLCTDAVPQSMVT